MAKAGEKLTPRYLIMYPLQGYGLALSCGNQFAFAATLVDHFSWIHDPD